MKKILVIEEYPLQLRKSLEGLKVFYPYCIVEGKMSCELSNFSETDEKFDVIFGPGKYLVTNLYFSIETLKKLFGNPLVKIVALSSADEYLEMLKEDITIGFNRYDLKDFNVEKILPQIKNSLLQLVN